MTAARSPRDEQNAPNREHRPVEGPPLQTRAVGTIALAGHPSRRRRARALVVLFRERVRRRRSTPETARGSEYLQVREVLRLFRGKRVPAGVAIRWFVRLGRAGRVLSIAEEGILLRVPCSPAREAHRCHPIFGPAVSTTTTVPSRMSHRYRLYNAKRTDSARRAEGTRRFHPSDRRLTSCRRRARRRRSCLSGSGAGLLIPSTRPPRSLP